jgi:hypothetical protein
MKYISKYVDFIEVWYKTNSKNLGRLEAELSVCDEWNDIKPAICDNLYYDIDGINMGYQIFYQSYKFMSSDDPKAPKLPTIENFINSREYWTNLIHETYFTQFDKENSEVKFAIKQLFIRLLNGGTVKKWKDDYNILDKSKMISLVGLLEKEIKLATKTLFSYIPEFEIKSNSSEKNTISHFIYETEKKCVEQLYLALGSPVTYMYCKDGIMVLKSEYTEEQIEQIIETAKENIFCIYALNIDFKIKPMINHIELSDLTPKEYKGYEFQREKFEQKYCKVKDLVLFPYKSLKGEIKFHTEKQLIGAERDFCPPVDQLEINNNGKEIIKKVRFIDKWLDDNDKKCYDDIDVFPSDIANKCPSNVYNLWTPFLAESYEPCPEDECIDELEFLLNHILVCPDLN